MVYLVRVRFVGGLWYTAQLMALVTAVEMRTVLLEKLIALALLAAVEKLA